MSVKADPKALADLLADLTSKTYSCHDRKDFVELEETSKSLLVSIGVADEAAVKGSKLVSRMYSMSDDADMQLLKGNVSEHERIFSRISEEARELDRVIGLKRGSVADEVRWWRLFRLAYDKNRSAIVRRYYLLAAFFAALREHYRRLGSLRGGFVCASYLGRAGLAHKVRDTQKEVRLLRGYWLAKIEGNGFRVDQELFSM